MIRLARLAAWAVILSPLSPSATPLAAQVAPNNATAATGSVNATFTIAQNLTVTVDRGIGFGLFAVPGSVTAARSTTRIGQFTVVGNANQSVTVSVTLPTTLVGPSGATLAVSAPFLVFSPCACNDNGTGGFDNGTLSRTVTLQPRPPELAAELGLQEFHVGCTVTGVAGIPAGLYSGVVAISIDY